MIANIAAARQHVDAAIRELLPLATIEPGDPAAELVTDLRAIKERIVVDA